ncbi:amidase [Ramlibacter henchirensis]|uniref:amidase n=1 Tax=Ramlibacter henchirensis TaxID=204072 RepID=UPI001430ED5D|nr:amidase [Ramlibacter henchirensis]
MTDQIEAYVNAAAAVFGTPHADRAPLWSQRLASALPDLQRLANADTGDDCPPIGPATAGALPAGTAPHSGSLYRLAQDVSRGRTDPVARVEAALAATDAGAALNAMRHVDAMGAIEQARALRDRAARGERVGRLAGVLVAVKDCLAVAGMPLTFGTRSLPVQRPASSAECVQRLQREDAIVVGMTTMHELAYGATTDNPHDGRVRHPGRGERLAGGSSGGSAVAVATGMADIALGTDTAGSVRMPAALCGISGFKSSFGLIPLEGVLPLAWSLDHVGTFAKSALDHVLLTEIMAGLPEGALARPAAADLRAFAVSNYFLDPIDPEVREIYEAALDKLRRAGVSIDAGAVDAVELAPTLQFFTICAEAAQVHMDRGLRRPEGLGDEVRVRLETGQFLRAVDYIKAQRLRGTLRSSLHAPLQKGADVLITPAVVTPAPEPGPTVEIGAGTFPIHPALTRCTLPFNLTGMPAITVPCGRTQLGLPVGLQLAGTCGDDAQLLAAAARFETILGA